MWIRTEASPAQIIVLVLNQQWKQRINNYLLKFFILFGNIIVQSNWITFVFPFVVGFIRHPFFLSPAPHAVVRTNSLSEYPNVPLSLQLRMGALAQDVSVPSYLLPGDVKLQTPGVF